MSTKELMIGDKPLSSLRVVDLKAELEKRGLSKSGTKKDLVDRLKSYIVVDGKEKIEDSENLSHTENEEGLPNIAEKLADDNPFVREYLASQAELFHSQQVAKKLYREEQKKESEGSGASADEREKSPLKSPKKAREPESPVTNQGETPKSDTDESSPDKDFRSREAEQPPEKSADNNTKEETKETPRSEEIDKLTVSSSEVATDDRTDKVEKVDVQVEEEKSDPEEEAIVCSQHEVEKGSSEDEQCGGKEENENSQEVPERDDDADDSKQGYRLTESEGRHKEAEIVESPPRRRRHHRSGSESSISSEESVEVHRQSVTKDESTSEDSDEAEKMEVDEKVKPNEVSSSNSKLATSTKLHEEAGSIQGKEQDSLVSETAELPVSRRSSGVIEKENILDDVLDYGEDESAEFEEMRESTFKRTHRRPKEEPKVVPKVEVRPARKQKAVTYEKRILQVKKSNHAERCRAKLEETRRSKKENEKKLLVVTSSTLKEWYPNLRLVGEEELNLGGDLPTHSHVEPEVHEGKVRIIRTISALDTDDSDLVHGEIHFDDEPEKGHEMDLTIQRKISIISMEKEDLKGQTPPRRDPTQLILVTNLVRPFTVPQLKELLQRTGNVVDLWVDKIKSKCVAKFDKEDEAIETRTALHGVKWPMSNPKTLSVDYVTEERFGDLRKRDTGYVEEKPITLQRVREWDVGKKSPRGKRTHSPEPIKEKDRDRNKEHKRSRRSSSHGQRHRTRSPHSDRRDRNGDMKKSESSGKTLDELFRKTVATPCIYWLPLTPEQIAEKEENRRKRMEERERRLAEMQQQRSQR